MENILDYQLAQARAQYLALMLSQDTSLIGLYRLWKAERRVDRILRHFQ